MMVRRDTRTGSCHRRAQARGRSCTANTALDDAMGQVANAVNELEDLHEACQGGGQTYETRVAKREAEVEALKEAYEILDNYSE